MMRVLAPLLVAAAVLAPGISHAELESEVKAAYLYRFLSYLEWPQAAAEGDRSPFVIGVMGADDVYDALKDIVQGRVAQGRPIEVRRLREGDDSLGIHVLFVGKSAAGILPKLAARNAIVVSEVDGALRRGAAINLVRTADHVRFEVAPAAAERKGVRISSRMLAVAAHVETGTP
jgi:hypothetical protein